MNSHTNGVKPWQCLILLVFLLSNAQFAYPMPSFSRQTGHPCTQCHTNAFGPALNSYGRSFKLSGYTEGDWTFPPLSVMLLGPSYTHANKDVPVPTPPFGKNNNLTVDQVSLFYAGKIFASDVVNSGALIQVTYDPNADAVAWDNADIRFARDFDIKYGHDTNGHNAHHIVTTGISLNNNPTVQDLWNTTPAWGFPFATTANGDLPTPPGAAAPLISSLGQTVGGATVYAMIEDLIPGMGWNGYMEAGAYATLAQNTQRTFGILGSDTGNQIDGGAPYWRVALERDFPHAYLEVGHYGMIADIFPGRIHTAGTDHYTDLAVDATFNWYPYDKKTHIFQLWGTAIWEDQHLSASQLLGLTGNLNSTLTTYNINGSYTYNQTYQLNLGYFYSHGSTDAVLWTNPSGNPDSDGVIVEFDYTPFGKSKSLWAPNLNVRFALQYTIFTTYLGSGSNYDGSGRNASDNDTLFLNSWFAF